MTTEQLIATAAKNISDIANLAIEHNPDHKMVVIYDVDSDLASILFSAYQKSFPDALFIQFSEENKQNILDTFTTLGKNDFVVLIQSADFRLSEFRIRIHLFERGIRVVDHMHLMRNTPDSYHTYVNALEYDPEWYRGVGHKLKNRLAETKTLEIVSGEQKLIVTGGLENPKPNLGDYSEMKNIGGTFPIGEVFTEAKVLESVNGSLEIYAFADVDFNIAMHDPFHVNVERGLIVSWSENTPQAFIDVIEKIKTNERPLLRELGFGMNRAITREHYLRDITAYERILGLHVSLGEKHTVYKKEGIKAKKTRFHVDVFLNVDYVLSDGMKIFENGEYLV